HIPSDIKAIYQVLEALDDFTLRNSVFVAPCLQHDEGAKFIFSIYKSSDLVIGTRFHSNVCAISMGVPTIGLVALDRVKYLYDKFG
ncbi:polysaccharide pyruvyl transferase family protein, partial [Bacillus sp. SIMBA_154]|uniref:polysaccharide pyruvyl transferase family protein n=1 Tax=Bacillus sp. SIMBA_154 TaxID=3080859 RepID=UPI00397DA747